MDDQKCHKLDFLFEYLRKQNQDDKKLWNHIKVERIFDNKQYPITFDVNLRTLC